MKTGIAVDKPGGHRPAHLPNTLYNGTSESSAFREAWLVMHPLDRHDANGNLGKNKKTGGAGNPSDSTIPLNRVVTVIMPPTAHQTGTGGAESIQSAPVGQPVHSGQPVPTPAVTVSTTTEQAR